MEPYLPRNALRSRYLFRAPSASDMHLPSPEIDAFPLDAVAEPALRAPTWRRRLLWTSGAALLLALLILTPPLVNANRYRGKIAESMSKSLGRPVHLDNVSLHLLPVPGFTLQNLVVSEDPAFGAEPTIRAMTVEATLRVSSLWHRPVEFSTVRFVDPSVNLVRNAGGRWNLSDVLLNASHVQSAPTAQRKAGPKPRFPYIEATGGRVNIKFGPEKLPFSLTEADFALWLPSSQQWRVRLVGHPVRTDTNITDPGNVRIEGELRHAATAAQVPVHFTASWHDAPLGEVSSILTGADWGWRGALNVDATLDGTLGGAQVGSKVTVGGLRRAEFFPARTLDLQVTCGSGFTLHPATMTEFQCSLPTGAPEPLVLHAPTVHLQNIKATEGSLEGAGVPMRWALLWAAMFSPRVPTALPSQGTLDVNLRRTAPGAAPPAAFVPDRSAKGRRAARRAGPPVATSPWTGSLLLKLPIPSQEGAAPGVNVLAWTVVPSLAEGRPTLRLTPTPVILGAGGPVVVSGQVQERGYSFNVSGTTPTGALFAPVRYLPELGDGLEAVLPTLPAGAEPTRLQFSCSRTWGQAQICTGGTAAGAPVGNTGTVNGPQAQPLPSLAPNLSPLK